MNAVAIADFKTDPVVTLTLELAELERARDAATAAHHEALEKIPTALFEAATLRIVELPFDTWAPVELPTTVYNEADISRLVQCGAPEHACAAMSKWLKQTKATLRERSAPLNAAYVEHRVRELEDCRAKVQAKVEYCQREIENTVPTSPTGARLQVDRLIHEISLLISRGQDADAAKLLALGLKEYLVEAELRATLRGDLASGKSDGEPGSH